MIPIPWQPALSKRRLDEIVNPALVNQPECVPHVIYDTQAIANAAAGPFQFFQTQNADKTLTNVEGNGQLPDPQYFFIHYVTCDFLQIPTVTAHVINTAAVNIANVFKTNRATFTFNVSQKLYGPFPLMSCHAMGGVTGTAYGYGALAGGVDVFAVNNGDPGSGGFPFSGSVLIPPKVSFNVTVNVAAAVALSATVNMRIGLVGVLYRRVL